MKFVDEIPICEYCGIEEAVIPLPVEKTKFYENNAIVQIFHEKGEIDHVVQCPKCKCYSAIYKKHVREELKYLEEKLRKNEGNSNK